VKVEPFIQVIGWKSNLFIQVIGWMSNRSFKFSTLHFFLSKWLQNLHAYREWNSKHHGMLYFSIWPWESGIKSILRYIFAKKKIFVITPILNFKDFPDSPSPCKPNGTLSFSIWPLESALKWIKRYIDGVFRAKKIFRFGALLFKLSSLIEQQILSIMR